MPAKPIVTPQQAREEAFALSEIVTRVGRGVMDLKRISFQVADIEESLGHDSSTIDVEARNLADKCINVYLPDFEGTILFEYRPYTRQSFRNKTGKSPFQIVMDEIDGTTNTKRALATILSCKPHSAVAMSIGNGPKLKDIYASAIHMLDSEDVYMAIRNGDTFYTYQNGTLINEKLVSSSQGDSKNRILVIGYSNSFRIAKGEVEQLLYDQGFKVYDGCRASTVDIINIIRNSNDAYIDLRSFWSLVEGGVERNAMLQVYDVAAVIPCAIGCGLMVSDALGKSWEGYGGDETIPLVVARPEIHEQILEIIGPFVEKQIAS